MRSDHYEYDSYHRQDFFFLDEETVDELLLYRPVGQTTKDAYWSLYKIGKGANIFKSPQLKEENDLDDKLNFVEFEKYFDNFKGEQK